MPKTVRKTTKRKKATKTAKKAPKKKITWNDKDESLFWALMRVPPLDNGKFSADYKKYLDLSDRRTRFKIQELEAGRKLKYK